MLNLNPINLNKSIESIPDRVGDINKQKQQFNSILLEFKMRQINALSGLFGNEKETRSDPLTGYSHLLLDTLKAKNNLLLQQGAQQTNVSAIDANPIIQSSKNDFQKEQEIRLDNMDGTQPGQKPGTSENVVQSQSGAKQGNKVEVAAVLPALPTTEKVQAKAVSNPTMRDMARDAAKKYGIPEQWFEKLIQGESAFDPMAVSPKGAMGLGQLMPGTAKDMGLRIGSPLDRSAGSVWNPASNLDASARYLRQLYDRYSGMGIGDKEAWNFTAGAYNAGMGNIQKAMDRLDDDTPLAWKQLASVLPKVTGQSSRETLRYVENLRA